MFRDVEQMGGVLRCPESPAQHGVVAGMLAFAAETPAAQPDDGVEPVEAAKKLAGELKHPVPSSDVRELVSEDDTASIVAPRCRPQAG